MPRKVIITNNGSLSHVVCLTSAIKALHESNPGQFATDVRCNGMELFHNNPHITVINTEALEVNCTVSEPNRHMTDAIASKLGTFLGVCVGVKDVRGDIYQTAGEKASTVLLEGILGYSKPYMLIHAGYGYGKAGKWWDGWDNIIASMPETLFVQVGNIGDRDNKTPDYHYPLKDAKNLVSVIDKTPNMRDLFRLVYHADAVLTTRGFFTYLGDALDRPYLVTPTVEQVKALKIDRREIRQVEPMRSTANHSAKPGCPTGRCGQTGWVPTKVNAEGAGIPHRPIASIRRSNIPAKQPIPVIGR